MTISEQLNKDNFSIMHLNIRSLYGFLSISIGKRIEIKSIPVYSVEIRDSDHRDSDHEFKFQNEINKLEKSVLWNCLIQNTNIYRIVINI